MKLPKLAIDNYPFTIVVFMLLLVMGVSSLMNMPRTEDPPMDIPGASVIVIYPGGNPVDLEELIANPVEEALNELDDIKVMNCWIRDGIVSVSIEFSFDTDAQDKFDEVVRQVNSVRSELPEDIYDLQVLQWSSTDVVMLQLAMVSESAGFKRMSDRAEELKKEIEKLSGIRRVEIFAAPAEEVRISLDMETMAVMKISVEDIARAIRSSNANIPGGELRVGMKSFNVKTSGSYKELDEIRNTVVASYMGSLVFLKDVARVGLLQEDYNYRARFNGERAIFITVKQKEGLNIFTIGERLGPIIKEFSSTLDPDIRLETVFDQAESVNTRINGFFMNLVQGIVLVGIFIFLSLGYRASILVIIAIPLSIVIGLGWVDAWGFGLQQISIAALVIALGLLVDNSIVITENIERFMRRTNDRSKAAAEASSQLGWPIVTATLTTILAFIPIITMPDKAGRFIQSLPVTVILTLLASLLIALTLTPYLASRFFKSGNGSRKHRGFRSLLDKLIEGPYQETLRFALPRGWLIIGIALLCLAGTGFLFTKVGVSFFPKAEKPQFLIRISVPGGYSIEKTDEAARFVESVLDTIPLVKHYASNVGHGNPRIYYNTFPRRNEKNFAEIFVELHEYEVEEFDGLIARLRRSFNDYPGARINVKEFEQGSPIEAPLTIKITGNDLDTLKRLSAGIFNLVENTPGVVNPDNNLDSKSTDIWFRINREKANMLGVPIHAIDMTLRTALAGSVISEFRDKSGNEMDIVLRLPVNESIRPEDLQKIYIQSLTGEMIPLRHLVSMEFMEAPGIISHYNLSRDATITGDIQKGYFIDDVVE
ncbi:MAG: efflux RND transporter permease subunit, partial [Bacteroidales bacterium]|nr:efflux RND transporter permease subunit [Bacteroidales bacterium]